MSNPSNPWQNRKILIWNSIPKRIPSRHMWTRRNLRRSCLIYFQTHLNLLRKAEEYLYKLAVGSWQLAKSSLQSARKTHQLANSPTHQFTNSPSLSPTPALASHKISYPTFSTASTRLMMRILKIRKVRELVSLSLKSWWNCIMEPL